MMNYCPFKGFVINAFITFSRLNIYYDSILHVCITPSPVTKNIYQIDMRHIEPSDKVRKGKARFKTKSTCNQQKWYPRTWTFVEINLKHLGPPSRTPHKLMPSKYTGALTSTCLQMRMWLDPLELIPWHILSCLPLCILIKNTIITILLVDLRLLSRP